MFYFQMGEEGKSTKDGTENPCQPKHLLRERPFTVCCFNFLLLNSFYHLEIFLYVIAYKVLPSAMFLSVMAF